MARKFPDNRDIARGEARASAKRTSGTVYGTR